MTVGGAGVTIGRTFELAFSLNYLALQLPSRVIAAIKHMTCNQEVTNQATVIYVAQFCNFVIHCIPAAPNRSETSGASESTSG